MTEKARVDALDFLKNSRTGVLATAGHDGHPHTSVLHYHCDDKFNLYFMTLKNSLKYKTLIERPQVAFTVFSEDVPRMVQMEGTAKDISLSDEAGMRKDELFEILSQNKSYSAPITKLDIDEPAVIWIRPKSIRWADYSIAGDGSEKVLTEIEIDAQ